MQACRRPDLQIGGEAHTVMAGRHGGGDGFNDDRDSWKVHFTDTMRRPVRQQLADGVCTPKRLGPRPRARLGCRVRPDTDGTSTATLADTAIRLAHVGDRTGWLIRTLQDHGIHQGIRVYMEVTVVSFLKTATA